MAMAMDAQRSCFSGSGSPEATAQLPLHQVQAGDGPVTGMLHLQAGVHLHEVKAGRPVLGDELHRAGADVADGLAAATAASPISRRAFLVMPGAGPSSSTFW